MLHAALCPRPAFFAFAALTALGSALLSSQAQAQILDLRADDPTHLTLDSSNHVLAWQNEVGGGQLFTPTAGTGTAPVLVQNAINGLPAVRFDGVNNILSSIGFGAAPQELTLFIVAAPLSNAGSYRAFFSGIDQSAPGHQDYVSGINFDQTGGGSSTFDRLNLEGAKGGGGGGISLPVNSTFGSYNLLEVGYGNTTDTVYVNGTDVGSRSGNNNTVSLQDVRIGGRYYDNGGGPYETGYLNGDIAEVIVYDSLLTDPQRQSVEQALTTKYFTPASVPEPGALALLMGSGMAGAGFLTRRRHSRSSCA